MSPIHFMIAAFSLYVDFWCGVGFMHSKVAQDQPLVNMFMLWSVVDMNAAAFCATNSYHSYGTVILLPIYRTYFGIILQVNVLFSLFDEFKGRRMSW